MAHPLARAREARGWTRAEFARRLRAIGARRGIGLGTGKDGVLRWEMHGRRPDAPTQRMIACMLGIPAEMIERAPWPGWLEHDPLRQATDHPWTAAGAIEAINEVRQSMGMERRDFAILTGAALTTSLWGWLTADPAAAEQLALSRRVGENAVGRIEDRVRHLRHVDDLDGGGQLLTETAASLELVVHLLTDRSYSSAHGCRLYAAAADLARMHAWALFDVHGECSDTGFQAALRSAHASSDPALGGHILAFWSIAAYNTGRARDAETMTLAALSAVRGRTTPAVEGMLLSRRARARARLGDQAAFTDLDRAGELLDRSDGDDPEWVHWFDANELLGARASTCLDLDQPRHAEEIYQEAAAGFTEDRPRTHCLFTARRAHAQYLQGDLERACATAHEAVDLAEEISSHRTTGPLHDLARLMAPHTGVPAVRDLRERLRLTSQ